MYYFIYSQQQYNTQEAAYKKGGKTYIPGKVTVGGQVKLYTSITRDLKATMQLFGDSKVITMVDTLSDVHYTKPTSNSIRRVV